MKKALLNLFILLGIGMNAQDTTTVIIIDSRTGTIKAKPTWVKYRGSVSFMFKNINPLLITTDVSSKPFNFETEVPVVLTDLISAPDSKLLENIQNLSLIGSESINSIKAVNADFEKAKNSKALIQKKIGELEFAMDQISPLAKELSIAENADEGKRKEYLKQYKQLVAKIQEINRAIGNTNAQIEKQSKTVEEINKKIESYNNTLIAVKKTLAFQELTNKYKMQFLAYYDSIVRSINNLSALSRIESYIRLTLKDYILDSAIVKANLKSYMFSFRDKQSTASSVDSKFIQGLRDKAQREVEIISKYYTQLAFAFDTLALSLQDDSLKLTGKLEDKEKKTTLDITASKVMVKRKKYFEDQFNYATKQNKLFMSDTVRAKLSEGINRGIDLFVTIMESNFTVSEGPFEITDDSHEFNLKLKNSKGETVKDFNTVTINSYGRLKVDFSAGYLASFIGDDNYSSFNDSLGKIKGFSAGPKEYVTHSIGGLFHAYWQSRSAVRFGGSAGFSVPLEGKFNFYFGASAHFLEKNRLVFTVGASFVQVNRLNTAQLTEVGKDRYEILKGNTINEPAYNKVFRPAVFLGLTYNLINIKK